MNREVTYFTDKGDFGNANGLIRIDTTKWTAEDWTKIINANAISRKVLAMQIEQKQKESK